MSLKRLFLFSGLTTVCFVILLLIDRFQPAVLTHFRNLVFMAIDSDSVTLDTATDVHERSGLQLNLTILLGLAADFALERVDKRRVRQALERYVSRDVVREMLDRPKVYEQALGGVTKRVTILFSDIRGYSKVSAQSDPHVLVEQLNEYLIAMVECVFRFGGTLDKFMGDAVMAVWGNVRSAGAAQDAVAAVRAALAMREELTRLNTTWRAKGWPEFRIGIALNHGAVVAGKHRLTAADGVHRHRRCR